MLPSCGGMLSESSGKISSPSLPGVLPHDIDCFWNIQVPRAIHVNINVIVAWQRDEKCSNHVLIGYTSDDNQNTVKICGREELHGNLVIRSNNVWIKYHIEVDKIQHKFEHIIPSGTSELVPMLLSARNTQPIMLLRNHHVQEHLSGKNAFRIRHVKPEYLMM